VLTGGSKTGDDQGIARLEVVLLGHERRRRGVQAGDYDIQFPQQRRDDLPGQPEHVAPLLTTPEEDANLYDLPDLVQAEPERQPGDTGVADNASGNGQAVCLSRGVQVGQQRTPAGPRPFRLRVDADLGELAEIDHQAVVGDRLS